MRKISIILLSAILLSGCAGMGNIGSQKSTKQADDEDRLRAPIIKVTKDMPEGEFIQKYDNGRIQFKTYVQNGCFDKYMDVYYPNGQLQTHTPLFKCMANGLSQGYLENGALRAETPYVDSYAQGETRIYDKYGKVYRRIMYDKGYPISDEKVVNPK